MNVKLHDLLDEAVADVAADLPTLTTASRRHGLAIRRRRRTLSAVGAVAAVSVLAAGGYLLAPGPDGAREPAVATDAPAPTVPRALSGETAPITGRGTAAALAAAVDDVAEGTFGRFQGADQRHQGFATLLFEPRDGTGPAGQVMINLQPLGMGGRAPYDCDQPYMEDCTVRELPNGDTLRTYWERDDTEFGAGSQRMAVEVLSPERRLRVVVNTLNTNPWADGATRKAPVLTLEQATDVATQPWWSRTELPVEYVDAGRSLAPYEQPWE